MFTNKMSNAAGHSPAWKWSKSMPTTYSTSRRNLLKASALTLAGLTTRRRGWGAAESPNELLSVAVVGVDGRGGENINEMMNEGGAQIVALCDVDEKRAGKMRERFPKARFVVDYRRLLDQKDIDAVLVATPDHNHAPATILALKAGKHVYCEKPLTHTLDECRAVREAAAKYKRVTQMGTQIHATSNYRRVVELIQSGAIGPVGEVHVWVSGGINPGDRPKDTPPVPEGLHYGLWLGPAPVRPYHTAYVPYNWRGWWDFGGGTLGDMACHYMDLPFWALKLRTPKTVVADGPPVHPESCPSWLTVRYEFAARETLPAVTLTWYNGDKRPPQFAEGKIPKDIPNKTTYWGAALLFVGSRGMLIANYDGHMLLPEKDFEGFTPPPKTISDSIGHHREWVEACKTGGVTTCNFDYSGALTEAVLLGNVSYRSGQKLDWDAKSLKAVNAPQADKYIRHHYREGWTL
jgi:predicted dehydrogenase